MFTASSFRVVLRDDAELLVEALFSLIFDWNTMVRVSACEATARLAKHCAFENNGMSTSPLQGRLPDGACIREAQQLVSRQLVPLLKFICLSKGDFCYR